MISFDLNFEWQLLHGMAGDVASMRTQIEKFEKIEFYERRMWEKMGDIRRTRKTILRKNHPLEMHAQELGIWDIYSAISAVGSYMSCLHVKF